MAWLGRVPLGSNLGKQLARGLVGVQRMAVLRPAVVCIRPFSEGNEEKPAYTAEYFGGVSLSVGRGCSADSDSKCHRGLEVVT